MVYAQRSAKPSISLRNVHLEPRYKDEATNRVFLNFNLHIEGPTMPEPTDIDGRLHQAVDEAKMYMTRLDGESYSPQTRAYLKPLANRELIDRLEELRQSGETYVYPGGRRPVEAAFEDARRFLENLPELVRKPTITLVIDGEINFSWDYGDLYIDLGFYGDGEGGSYFAEDRYGREYGIESFDPSTLPDEILRLITS